LTTIPQRVFVSGANGFIGRAVVARLQAEGIAVRLGVRRRDAFADQAEIVMMGDLPALAANWEAALAGCDSLVHAAGIAHQAEPKDAAGRARLFAVNAEGAARVAEAARRAGLRRVVLVSSAVVHGRSASEGLTEIHALAPENTYAASKCAAEQAMQEALVHSATALTIIRPTAVYGAGCQGNLPRLMRLIQAGLPLPFGSLSNRRSFLAVEALAELVCRALLRPQAANETFLAADAAPIATPELIRALAEGLGVPARLFACPPVLLQGAAALLGRSDDIRSLTASFWVKSDKAQHLLGWRPPGSSRPGLIRTAQMFREARQLLGKNSGPAR
jgi:nucleoside-diphosphate-sugar epimerase